MKTSKKKNGRTGTLLWWPLFLLPIFISDAIFIFVLPEYLEAVLIGTAAVVLVFLAIWFLFWKKRIKEELNYFAQSFNEIQSSQLETLSVASVLVNSELEILWQNKRFRDVWKKSLGDYVTDFDEDVVLAVKELFIKECEGVDDVTFNYEGTFYRAEFKKSEDYTTIWLFDETVLNEKNQVINDMNPAVIEAYFDNFEEESSKLDDMQKSVLIAQVQKDVTEYFSGYGAIVTAYDKCKYFINLDNKTLCKIREDKFSILETIKDSVKDLKIKPTLSMGVGCGGKDVAENLKYAKAAMSLCLGRGGDQAVLKSPEGNYFYGGKTERKERSTRLRARIFAMDLKKMIEEKDTILIMSHKYPDTDAFGSSIGLYRIARSLGKESHIVLDEVPETIKPLYDNIVKESDTGEKILISKKEARDIDAERAAIIFTDVNRPSLVEAEEIYKRIKTRAVIDHHRVSEEPIEDVELARIETTASSASELICEIVQYISSDDIISESEAEALYAGIVIDSDNFLTKTSYKTFEAAAYLKKMGADTVNVRKILRESKEDFVAKTDAASSADIYKGQFAFGICDPKGLKSPTVTGAKVANELLGISEVKASFVFTSYNGKVFVSARSIDEINVQLVMERVGGGGHRTVAGAQLEKCTLEEAIDNIKSVLDEMEKEGEI